MFHDSTPCADDEFPVWMQDGDIAFSRYGV
jgi:hypothetical protein